MTSGHLNRKENKKTKTSAFGTRGKICHDSSPFYARRIVPKTTTATGHINVPNKLDVLYCKSSERMEDVPDNSIHLMVTSPPYNTGKEYDDDLDIEEYTNLLKNVLEETYRVLVPGGRACINIANIGRKPYIPLTEHVCRIANEVGFNMRGEIIWDKSMSAGPSTAWGSWMSHKNPTIRDVHEYILVFSKGDYTLRTTGVPTINREEFLEYTKSIWRFKTESASRIGHPAPFPIELPSRCIKLYTGVGDIVIDPFIGSGTTAIAAMMLERHYIGYDNKQEYIDIAEKRIKRHKHDEENF